MIRIVKMTFDPEKVSEFLELFNQSKEKIRNMSGCTGLELLKDMNSPNIYFTYSQWNSEQDLNNYRNSELFAAIWPKTKKLFAAKAEAWSVQQQAVL